MISDDYIWNQVCMLIHCAENGRDLPKENGFRAYKWRHGFCTGALLTAAGMYDDKRFSRNDSSYVMICATSPIGASCFLLVITNGIAIDVFESSQEIMHSFRFIFYMCI